MANVRRTESKDLTCLRARNKEDTKRKEKRNGQRKEKLAITNYK